MDDRRDLPAAAQGGPIRGEAAIAGLVPFGLDQVKPRHFREAAAVAWENRDNLAYAWNILTKGVCDGCSLGPRGLADDVIPGVHVCMSRLKLLRQNTVGAFAPADIADISWLRTRNNEQLRALGRVPYPFVYRRGSRGFERISWDGALALVGSELRQIAPERQAWFGTSKGITNETYYVLQKVARLMGTNNVDFCARLCHQASVSGLGATIGYGAPTCSLSDLIGTDLVLLWGTNLANNQPVAVKYLHHAKEAGTRVVVINTTMEKGLQHYWIPSNAKSALFGSKIADDFVGVNAGGDIALATALAKLLIDWGALDRSFIADHTVGWDAYEAHVRAQDMQDLLARSGASFPQVEWLARLIARARSMVTVWSMGLTQHRFGTQNVMAVADLHLMRGMIGKEKSGLLPIRGHSGVQGGGEMAVNPHKFPGGASIDAVSAAKLAAQWGHPVPSTPGLTTVEMVDAAGRGELDFLYNIGGNLYATVPDPEQVASAFGRVRVRVHQDINVNTSTLLEPGEMVLLLPAQTRYEQRGGGTSTNTERRIRFSPEIPGHPQIGEARPEWEIPGLVAAAARPELESAVVYRDASDIRQEIPRLVPSYAGIENMRTAGDWVQWGGPMLCANGDFPAFPDRRARFVPVDLPHNEVPAGWYALVNRRGKQFNSMVFSNEDTLQGGLGRTDVLLSGVDAAREGLADGDPVRLVNSHGEFRGVARINDIRAGHLQVYWPESNALLPRVLDPVSFEPDYHTHVRLERV